MPQMQLFYVSRDGRAWVSAREASRLLGVSQQRVYQLCKEGLLDSTRVDGQRWISEKSVVSRLDGMAEGMG